MGPFSISLYSDIAHLQKLPEPALIVSQAHALLSIPLLAAFYKPFPRIP